MMLHISKMKPNQWARTFSMSLRTTQKKALILGVYETSDDDAGKKNLCEGTPKFEEYNKQTNGRLKSLLGLAKPLKAGAARVFYDIEDEYCALSVASLGKKDPEDVVTEGCNMESENTRKAMAAALRSLKDLGLGKVDVDNSHNSKAAAEGIFLSSWSYKQSNREKFPSEITPLNKDGSSWDEGKLLANGQNFARFLMDSPANMMNPTIFADTVKEKLESCGTKGEIEVKIRDESWIREQKMGAFLSVTQGSSQPPKFVEIHYKGPGTSSDNSRPLVLVGKGVTFDSGGISIKPSGGMDEMRADMGGAATVASSILTAATLDTPGHVVGLIPLCENLINGHATKPGDVVTARDGTTIQVDNTDAEGRLILADALCYSREFSPSAILDVATLTLAIRIALGAGACGVFSNCNHIWNILDEAGHSTGDRVWRMPLYQLYSDHVKPAHLADINNVGKGAGAAGSCTAAAFLKHFVVKDTPWAHLDIAGVMNNGKGEVSYLDSGMAGRPTRTLAEFIRKFNDKN